MVGTIRPKSAVAYFTLAQGLQERGDWPEVLVVANRAIAINQNYAMAHYYLGLALRHKQDLPGAVVAFQRRSTSTLPLPEATGGWAMPNSRPR